MNFHLKWTLIFATIMVTITNALPNRIETKSLIRKVKRSQESFDGGLEIPYGDGRVIIDQFLGSIIINVYSNDDPNLIPAEATEKTRSEGPVDDCPNSLIGNICMSDGCTSNSSCSFNEMCCFTEVDMGSGTTCCKSLNGRTTRPVVNPWTTPDPNAPKICPQIIYRDICLTYGCKSNSSCESQEICCYDARNTACCKSIFPESTTTSTTEPTITWIATGTDNDNFIS